MDAGRSEPIGEWGLVKVANAIDIQCYVVMAHDHLFGGLRVDAIDIVH
jgi:hypothetical protein